MTDILRREQAQHEARLQSQVQQARVAKDAERQLEVTNLKQVWHFNFVYQSHMFYLCYHHPALGATETTPFYFPSHMPLRVKYSKPGWVKMQNGNWKSQT